MPDGLRITAIVAAFNEADIIQQTVGELVQQGIAVHVLDDASTDGTVAALEPLRASGLVRIEAFQRDPQPDGSQGYPWSAILARKEQLGREPGSDWFIHHDADEFRESPWRHLNLREGIELVDRLGYNAIDFAVLNFRPTHDRFDGATDIRETFPFYEPGASFDRLQVKCWKQAADLDLVSSGGHDARFEGRSVFPLRFIVRHYPIRGQAHGTRKVFAERNARFPADERRRGWHVQYKSFQHGQQFLHDPGSLHLYDPDAVRVRLQLEHRGVEALQAIVAELDGRLEAAREALHEQEAEAARARASCVAEANRLAAQVSGLQQEAMEQASAYRVLEQQFRGLEDGYRALEQAHRALEAQLAEMRASWSWKLTAPLRTAWRRPTP